MMNDVNQPHEYDEHPYTEYLDFTFSSFGVPYIDQAKGMIVLPVREFSIDSGFPGYDRAVIVLEGDVIFEKVTSSIREISEVDEDATSKSARTQYKPPIRMNDGPFPEIQETPFSFYIGGFTYEPPGWVEWYLDVVTIKVREHKSEFPRGA